MILVPRKKIITSRFRQRGNIVSQISPAPPPPSFVVGADIGDFVEVFDSASGGFIGSSGSRGICVSDDQTELYIGDVNFNDIQGITLPTPGDLTNQTDGGTAAETNPSPTGLYLNPDGSQLWQIANFNALHEIGMSTPFDVSTASLTTAFALGLGNVAQGVTWNNDGTKCYIAVNITGGKIHEFTCSVAFDFSTRGAAVIFDCSANVNSPTGLDFDGSGTKLYMCNVFGNADTIFQYNLGTAFDISSAVFDTSVVFSFVSDISYIHFDRPTGTAIYGVAHGNNEIIKLEA